MTLKIVVMGSGGVGGYFGARLAQAGCQVTFIARGSHLVAIGERGLRVESAKGDVTIKPARVLANPAEAGPADVVLFAVKMGDTQEAAAACKPLVEQGAAIFTFQNGVDSARVIGGILGPSAVVPGTAQIAAVIKEPGVIRHAGTMARLVFGEPDGARSARTQALLAACQAAGIDCLLSDEIERAVWMKFALLAPFAGLTAVTRGPIGPVRTTPAARRLLEAAVSEVVALAGKLGKGLMPDDVAKTLRMIDGMPAEMTSSMYHDLTAGKPLELDGLSGAVVRLAEGQGLSAPTHSFIAGVLSPFAAGRRG